MRKENNKIVVETKSYNLTDFFQEENHVSIFIRRISLMGSLYLEDQNFSSNEIEEIKSKAIEMGFIVHLSKIGTLVIDSNFLGGTVK